MPPLSPEPAELSSGSMSACRKSWAMVSPSARAGSGACDAARSTSASRATSPMRSSPTAAAPSRSTTRSSGARWPIAAMAAIRTTSGSAASVASRRSGTVAMECRTSPSVSTRRARASGASTPRSAPSTPTTNCSEVAPDHRSSVRCASIPVNPPSTTMPRSAPIASARGRPEPSAQAACSRRKARSSDRRPTSLRPGLAVEHLGEGVRRGDRGELVIAAECLCEDPDGADTGIASGLEGQVVGEAQRVDDRRRGRDGVECGLDSHGALLGGGTIAPPGRRRCCG